MYSLLLDKEVLQDKLAYKLQEKSCVNVTR